MSNFILRLITALILLPIFVLAIWYGGLVLKIILSIIAFVAMLEVAILINKKSYKLKFFSIIFCTVLLSIFLSVSSITVVAPILSILIFSSFLTILPNKTHSKQKFQELALFFILAMYVINGVLSLFWLQASPKLISRYESVGFIYMACLATWANDSFAYLGGKLLGKTQLYPNISHKKTMEGFFSGALLSIILVFTIKLISLQFSWQIVSQLTFFDLAAVALPSIFLAPLGDLVESKVKRIFEAKDSSNILPGHGGFLDRIDSLLVVIPWTACYALMIRPLIQN